VRRTSGQRSGDRGQREREKAREGSREGGGRGESGEGQEIDEEAVEGGAYRSTSPFDASLHPRLIDWYPV